MQKTILLYFLLFSIQAFAQNTIFEWEKLPKQNNKAADIYYQTNQGVLICELGPPWKYAISKDNGKTWHDIVLPANIGFGRVDFYDDDENNLYGELNGSIFKYDYTTNQFIPFFVVKNSWDGIIDYAIKGNKIYVARKTDFSIFNKDNASPIYTRLWTITHAYVYLGNKNYVCFNENSTNGTCLRFNDDASSVNILTLPMPFDYPSKIEVTASGKLFMQALQYLWVSKNDGNSWDYFYCKPVISTIRYHQMAINKANEMYVAVDDSLLLSRDEGLTWKNIDYPKNASQWWSGYFHNKKANQLILGKYSCNDIQFYSTIDDGKTWKSNPIDLDLPESKSLYVSRNGDVLNATCTGYNELYSKKDKTWKNINQNYFYNFYSVGLFPSRWLFKDWFKREFYESKDNGKSWSPYKKNPGSLAGNRDILRTQNNDLIILDSNNYYLSKDGGSTWEKVYAPNIGLPNTQYGSKVLFENGFIFFRDFYTKDKNFIQYYDENKKELNALKIPKISNESSFSELIFLDFLDNKRLCFASINYNYQTSSHQGKIMITSDFGETYKMITVKLDKHEDRFRFEVDAHGNFIYSTYKELKISYDEGEHWESIRGNLPNDAIFYALTISPDQNLYVSLDDNGSIYKSKYPLNERYKITGNVFEDSNENCIKDSNEKYLKNIKISANNGRENSILSSKNGAFRFNVFKGTYQISTDVNENLYTPCQTAYTVKIDSTKDSVYLDIPLKVKKYCADLTVSLGAVLPLRRCFSNTYFGQVCNEGSADATNTQITIQLDSLFDFEKTSLPIVSLINNKLILDAGTVAYGDCKNFSITFKVSCKATLGQEHCISTIANSVDDCGNNQSTPQAKSTLECRKNVGSYDPNDKTAFVDGRQNAPQIKAGQALEYLVRFQNTGTDTAFNIVVKDPIMSNLDASSIVMGASSHAYTYEVRENILYVNFKNIMLPDSNINEKTSHGFFKFRIKPITTLTTKDLVTNTAAIYFDFNDPIFTNEVILNKKTSKTLDYEREVDFLLYPNPANEQITLQFPQQMEDGSNAFLYNLNGHLIAKKIILEGNTTFDIQTLPKGFYFIQVRNKTQFGVRKFIKE